MNTPLYWLNSNMALEQWTDLHKSIDIPDNSYQITLPRMTFKIWTKKLWLGWRSLYFDVKSRYWDLEKIYLNINSLCLQIAHQQLQVITKVHQRLPPQNYQSYSWYDNAAIHEISYTLGCLHYNYKDSSQWTNSLFIQCLWQFCSEKAHQC